MKYIDYCYFNIYNLCYQTSRYGQDFTTRVKAMYLFTIGSGGWLLLAQSLYLHLVRHAWFASKGVSALFATTLYLLMAVLFHYIFIVRQRDQQIVEKYDARAGEHPRRRRHVILSLGVLILPYLALVYCAICFKGMR